MPIVSESEIPNITSRSNFKSDYEFAQEDFENNRGKASGVDAFLAAGAEMHPVTAFIMSDSKFDFFADMDKDYFPEDDIFGNWENYPELYSAKNAAHMQRMKNDIIRHNRFNEAIEENPVTGITSMLVFGAADPLGLVGAGATLPNKIQKGRKALSALEKTQEIGSAALKTSGGAVAGVTASEIALQNLQPVLSAEESLKAIAAGALLGGLLGGGVKGLEVKRFNDIAKSYKDDITKLAYSPTRQIEYEKNMVKSYNSSVGAMARDDYTMEDMTFVSSLGLEKLTSFISPTLRVMQSNSLVARKLFADLAEFSQELKSGLNGKEAPVSVEAMAKLYDKNLGLATRAEKTGWSEYRKSDAPKITRREYRKRLAQALRRSDTDINNDEIISKTAQQIRKDFFEPIKDAAIKAGIFDEDIQAKFAESYLTRMWDPQKILDDLDGFQNKLRLWATEKVAKQIRDVNEAFSSKQQKLNKDVGDFSEKISSNNNKIKEIESRDAPKFNYMELSTVKDDYLEFIKQDIGLQELGNYLSKYGLEDIAHLVNSALYKPAVKPTSLIQDIRKLGKIKHDDVLKSRDITNKQAANLFSEKGKSLDVMLRELIDEGYFPEYRNIGLDKPEDFMIDDLRYAIEEDIVGQGVYKDSDMSIVEDIRYGEAVKEDAIRLLSEYNITDYKNFYKNIYEDIKTSKRDLRKEAKTERERIKAARQAAREYSQKVRPLLKELKRMRNAETAALRASNRRMDTKIKKAKEKIDNIEAEKKGAISGFLNAKGEGISEYVEEVVDEITANLTKLEPNPSIPPYVSAISRGPLKEKLLDVDDVQFEEFLENDLMRVMDYYRHQMGTQIEMKNIIGSIDLKEQLQEVKDDYLNLIKNAPDSATRRKLQKEGQRVIRDIEGVRDILLNKYNARVDPDSKLVQAGVVLRDLQFMAKMGGVTLSSFPDVFRSIMVNGFDNTMDSLRLRTLSGELKKMSDAELEEYAIGFETELGNRLQSLAEISDPLGRGSALTRFSGNSANIFSKVTLINYWNDVMKSASGTATQIKMKNALLKGNNKKYLLNRGLSDFDQRILKEQIEKYGEGNLVGIKDWDINDPNVEAAAKKWKAAIKSESDTSIVTASAGDLPLFSNTPMGKIILQFRNFLIASHSKVFLRGLQARGPEAAGAFMGAAMMVAMGMVVAALKSEMSNRSAGLRGSDTNYDTSTWNKRKWLVEGLDRSGLAALMLEPLHISDKAFGVGPSMITGQGVGSRFGSRNTFGAIVGPTFGTVGDVALAGRAALSPVTGAEVSKSDIYAARRILPFQNAFIFRQIFDILERETGEAVGAK